MRAAQTIASTTGSWTTVSSSLAPPTSPLFPEPRRQKAAVRLAARTRVGPIKAEQLESLDEATPAIAAPWGSDSAREGLRVVAGRQTGEEEYKAVTDNTL